MSFEITGKLIAIQDVVIISDKFKKREFVIEHTEPGGTMDFTDQLKFQVTQEKCSLLDTLKVNDEVRVSFRIRGKRWEKDGRTGYFTNLEAWKIEKIAVTPGEFSPPPPLPDEKDLPSEEDADDLPF
jgi:hypothetical protein